MHMEKTCLLWVCVQILVILDIYQLINIILIFYIISDITFYHLLRILFKFVIMTIAFLYTSFIFFSIFLSIRVLLVIRKDLKAQEIHH